MPWYSFPLSLQEQELGDLSFDEDMGSGGEEEGNDQCAAASVVCCYILVHNQT